MGETVIPPKEGIFWVKVDRHPGGSITPEFEQYRYEWHLIYNSNEGYPDPDDPGVFFVELTTDHMFDSEDIVEIGPEVICPEPALAPRPHGN